MNNIYLLVNFFHLDLEIDLTHDPDFFRPFNLSPTRRFRVGYSTRKPETARAITYRRLITTAIRSLVFGGIG